MTRPARTTHRDGGFALLLALMALSLVLALGLATAGTTRGDARLAAHDVHAARGRAAARAGAEAVFARLLSDPEWRGTLAGTLAGRDAWRASATPGADAADILVASTGTSGPLSMQTAAVVTPSIVRSGGTANPPAVRPEVDPWTVALWRCDGLIAQGVSFPAVEIVDSSANGNDGTFHDDAYATAGYAPGVFGDAVDLDGADDWVEIASSPTLNPFGSFTLEAWVYPRGLDPMQIASKGSAYKLYLDVDAGALYAGGLVTEQNGGGVTVRSDTGVALWRWTHVAMVYDREALQLRLYLDGVLTGSAPLSAGGSGPQANAHPLSVGSNPGTQSASAGGHGLDWLNGLVDEFRLSAGTRTYGASAGTVAIWHLDDYLGDGGPHERVWDISSGANHGTLENADLSLAYTGGRFSGALNPDGVDDRVVVPHSASLELGSRFTIQTWIKLEGGPDQAVLAMGTPGGEGLWLDYFTIGSSSRLRATIATGDAGAELILTGLKLDVWQLISLTYDGERFRIYQDDHEAASAPVTGNVDTGEPLLLGTGAGGAPMRGLLDEVRVCNRAHGLAAIRADYQSHAPLTAGSNVVGLWNFASPGGYRTPDVSGRGHDALLMGLSPGADTDKAPAGFGLCMGFPGSGARLQVSGHADFDAEALTWSAWVRPESFGEKRVVLSKRSGPAGGSPGRGIELNILADGRAEFRVSADTEAAAMSLEPLLPYLWQHLAGSYDGVHARLYVMGVLRAEVPVGGPAACGEFLTVGAGPGGAAPFLGRIDEVRVDAGARTAFELDAPGTGGAPDELAPTADTLALYKFDRQGSVQVLPDDGLQGLHGDLVGVTDADLVAGRFGNALALDGESCWVRVADAPVLGPAPGEPFFIEVWVRPESAPGTVLEKPGQYALGLDTSARPQFQAVVGGILHTLHSPVPVALGTWTQLAASWDGRWLGLLVDGVTVTSSPADGDFAAGTADLTLGNGDWGGASGGQAWGLFHGAIDELRISDRLRLTDASIVGLWRLDEVQGPVIGLSYNLALDGVVLGDPTRGVEGRVQGAMDLDGADDGALVPHDPVMDPGPAFTLDLWVLPRATPPAQPQPVVQRAGRYGLYWQYVQGAPSIVFRVWSDGVPVEAATGPVTIGEWHYVAGVLAGGELELYLDGALAGAATLGGPPDAGPSNLEMGRAFSGGAAFAGRLDEVRLWNRAREIGPGSMRPYGLDGRVVLQVRGWR